MLGVDVSNHQREISWPSLKAAGVSFGWIKATEGVNFRDAYFMSNRDAAAAVGVPVGAYHFARPAVNEPGAEAAFFCDTIERAGALRPVLDLEVEPLNPAWALTWLQAVEERLGVRPVLYTYLSYLQRLSALSGATALRDYPLWLAAYGQNDGQRYPVAVPAGWTMAVHQYTSRGRLPGFAGELDLNYAESLETIRAYVLPSWLLPWVRWYVGGKIGPRPTDAPATIPQYGWDAVKLVTDLVAERMAPLKTQIEQLTGSLDRAHAEGAALSARVTDLEARLAELDALIVARTEEMDALRLELQGAIIREQLAIRVAGVAESKIAAAKAALG